MAGLPETFKGCMAFTPEMNHAMETAQEVQDSHGSLASARGNSEVRTSKRGTSPSRTPVADA
jgi:hypothetical protein